MDIDFGRTTTCVKGNTDIVMAHVERTRKEFEALEEKSKVTVVVVGGSHSASSQMARELLREDFPIVIVGSQDKKVGIEKIGIAMVYRNTQEIDLIKKEPLFLEITNTQLDFDDIEITIEEVEKHPFQKFIGKPKWKK